MGMGSGGLLESNDMRERRSPCPVACGLDIFGDRWTLLVVRDLMLGRSRYKEFASSPEGIPTNLLADRLERLLRHGVVRRIPTAPGAKQFGYELTEKGHALRPLILAIRDWGLKWEPGTEAARKEFVRMKDTGAAGKKPKGHL